MSARAGERVVTGGCRWTLCAGATTVHRRVWRRRPRHRAVEKAQRPWRDVVVDNAPSAPPLGGLVGSAGRGRVAGPSVETGAFRKGNSIRPNGAAFLCVVALTLGVVPPVGSAQADASFLTANRSARTNATGTLAPGQL